MNVKGFTLIELISILAVIAILTGFAWPSFITLMNSIESDTHRSQWIGFLNAGRSSAVSYQTTVTACPFDFDTNTCSKRNDGDWLLFTDANKNKILDDHDITLRSLPVNEKVVFRFYPDNRRYVQFWDRPSGIYSGLMTGLTVCPNGHPDTASVHLKINVMGRVAASKKRNDDGVILRESGSKTYPIKC